MTKKSTVIVSLSCSALVILAVVFIGGFRSSHQRSMIRQSLFFAMHQYLSDYGMVGRLGQLSDEYKMDNIFSKTLRGGDWRKYAFTEINHEYFISISSPEYVWLPAATVLDGDNP